MEKASKRKVLTAQAESGHGYRPVRGAVNVVSLRLARYVASVNLLRRRLRDLFARQQRAVAEDLRRTAACSLGQPPLARRTR